jgi:hypothetical protein
MLLALRVSRSNPDAVEKVLADSHLMSIAERSMVVLMRELADLWIDSGKCPSNGSYDTPADRNVEDIPAGRTWSLFQRVDSEFLVENPQWPELRRDGTLGYNAAPPRFEGASLEGTDWHGPLKHFGRQTAFYWFLRLLNSPHSRHIARCDKCRSYFAYERARKRTAENGVFCSKCKKTGSVKRVQSTRERRIRVRVGLAAVAWEQWKPTTRFGSRAEWVAQKVNTKWKETPELITRNWVTRHQTEIEAELERRNHGKG